MTTEDANSSAVGRARPFRRNLLVNLIALVLLLGASLFTVAELTLDRVLEKSSSTLAAQIVGNIEGELHGLFTPVGATLRLTLAAARAEVLGSPTLTEVEFFLESLMTTLPQISSAELARQNGDAFMLLREEDGGWLSRHMRPSSWGYDSEWRRRSAEGAVTEWRAPFEYEVTQRPWFVGALAHHREARAGLRDEDSVSWTEPYAFATTGDPGITASAAIEEVEGALLVVSLDVLLRDLSRFALDVTRSEPGLVFILDGRPGDAGARLLGVPFEPGETDTGLPILATPAEAGGVIADFSSLAAQGMDVTGAPSRFTSGDERWWGVVERSDLDPEHDVWIAVLIPERELREGLPPVQLITLIGTLSMLVVGVIMALRLARTYSEPVDSLVYRSQRMERLNFEPFAEPVRSKITELRQLAATFESLRLALAGLTSEREDLRIAEALHDTLASSEPVRVPPIEAAGWSERSAEVGGSVFDVRAVSGVAPGLGVLLLELGGHGIETATAVARLSSVFRAALGTGLPIEAVARQLREAAADLDRPGSLRFWLALADAASSRVEVVSMGLVWLVSEADESRPVRWFGDSELPAGADLQSASVTLEEGGCVAALSSGVTEAIGEDRRRWGRDGIQAALAAAEGRSAGSRRAALVAGLKSHHEGPAQDRALVVLCRVE